MEVPPLARREEENIKKKEEEGELRRRESGRQAIYHLSGERTSLRRRKNTSQVALTRKISDDTHSDKQKRQQKICYMHVRVPLNIVTFSSSTSSYTQINSSLEYLFVHIDD